MPTLLEYLSTPNPDLDRTNVKSGTNSFNIDWEEVEETSDWEDFTYTNLVHDFGDILSTTYANELLDFPTTFRGLSRRMIDETTVHAMLLKHNHVLVSRALELASDSPSREGRKAISWALGSHAPHEGAIYPDWAGVDKSESYPFKNRVPGDTKVSGKWRSRMKDSDAEQDYSEFRKPLRQVMHYAGQIGTRYGYVITDKEVMCIRRTMREFEGEPLSLHRHRRVPAAQVHVTPPRRSLTVQPQIPHTPPRGSPSIPQATRGSASPNVYPEYLTPPPAGRRRQPSITSTVSTFSEMSIDSPGNLQSSPSAYTDGGNPDVNQIVEIVSIPWENHGEGVMTVNLALFYIHMLAASDIEVKSSYPQLGRSNSKSQGAYLICVILDFD